MSVSRLTVAVLVAAALILSAPYVGQIRNAIRAAFPGHFVAILSAAVGLGAATALAVSGA